MTDEPPLSPHHVTRSAGLIVWGLVGTAAGLVTWMLGDKANLVAEIGGWGESPGTPAVALGIIGTVLGLGTLVNGVARVTTNIDVIAQVAAARLAEDNKARVLSLRARSIDLEHTDRDPD